MFMFQCIQSADTFIMNYEWRRQQNLAHFFVYDSRIPDRLWSLSQNPNKLMFSSLAKVYVPYMLFIKPMNLVNIKLLVYLGNPFIRIGQHKKTYRDNWIILFQAVQDIRNLKKSGRSCIQKTFSKSTIRTWQTS